MESGGHARELLEISRVVGSENKEGADEVLVDHLFLRIGRS
jgi:hypothetical protein